MKAPHPGAPGSVALVGGSCHIAYRTTFRGRPFPHSVLLEGSERMLLLVVLLGIVAAGRFRSYKLAVVVLAVTAGWRLWAEPDWDCGRRIHRPPLPVPSGFIQGR